MREMGALAFKQLAAWEKIADDWIMTPVIREDAYAYGTEAKLEVHFICPQCDATVYAASEQSITPAIFKAATVAHLRNRHRELDPDHA
jgi:hypothetical protein